MTKPKGKTNPARTASSAETGLGNPAAAMAAGAVASQIPWGFLIKTTVILGITGIIVYKITHRFEKRDEESDYPPANISHSQAQSRAKVIYTAMKGLGNGMEIVKANIANLNYNGWIRLYNAFGNRKGAFSPPFSSGENLEEWFADQFDQDELDELRVLVPNTF